MEPRSPTLQADPLPAEPQGKPKNTGVGQPIPSPGDLSDPGIEPPLPPHTLVISPKAELHAGNFVYDSRVESSLALNFLNSLVRPS